MSQEIRLRADLALRSQATGSGGASPKKGHETWAPALRPGQASVSEAAAQAPARHKQRFRFEESWSANRAASGEERPQNKRSKGALPSRLSRQSLKATGRKTWRATTRRTKTKASFQKTPTQGTDLDGKKSCRLILTSS